jgi:hypothetical protein
MMWIKTMLTWGLVPPNLLLSPDYLTQHPYLKLKIFSVQIDVTKRISNMAIPEITEKLLAAKKKAGLSFADLEAKVGCDEVWIASVIYRQASASKEEATKIVEAIGLILL